MSDHQVGEDSDGIWMCGPECFFTDMHDCPKWEACHKYHINSDPFRLPIEAIPDGWVFTVLVAMETKGGGVDYEALLLLPIGKFLIEGDREVYGHGPSPRAAMLNAIEQITK